MHSCEMPGVKRRSQHSLTHAGSHQQRAAATGNSSFIFFPAQKDAVDQNKRNTSFIAFFFFFYHWTPTFSSAALSFLYFFYFWMWPQMIQKTEVSSRNRCITCLYSCNFSQCNQALEIRHYSPASRKQGWKKRPICSHFTPLWYCGAAMVEQRNGTGGRWSSAPYPGGADDPWVNLICSSPADKHCRSSQRAAAEPLFMYHRQKPAYSAPKLSTHHTVKKAGKTAPVSLCTCNIW